VTGPKVHILAPGVNILAAGSETSHAARTGSSFASPFVAGAVALMSAYRPTSPENMREHILDTADTSTPFDVLSDGVLDIERMMTAPVNLNRMPVVGPSSLLILNPTNGSRVTDAPLLRAVDADGDLLQVESWTQPLTSAGCPSHGVVTLEEGNQLVYTLVDVPTNRTYEYFKVRVIDSVGGYGEGQIAITIDGANNPPETETDDVTYPHLSAGIEIPVLANDRDLDGDPLTLVSFSGSPGSFVDLTNGNSIYLSTALPPGSVITGVYEVSDGLVNATGTWFARVVPTQVFSAPVLTSPNRSFDVTNQNLTVSWLPVQYADDYHLILTEVATGIQITNVITTATSVPIGPLNRSMQYQIDLRGRAQGNPGPRLVFSFWTIPEIDPPTLLTPTNLSKVPVYIQAGDSNTVRFSWTAVSNAAFYRVQLTDQIRYEVPGNQRHFDLHKSSLSPRSTYNWSVRVYDTNAFSVGTGTFRLDTLNATEAERLRYRFTYAAVEYHADALDFTNRIQRGLWIASPQAGVTSRLLLSQGGVSNKLTSNAEWTWETTNKVGAAAYEVVDETRRRYVSRGMTMTAGEYDLVAKYSTASGQPEWSSPALPIRARTTTHVTAITNRQVIPNLLLGGPETRVFEIDVPQLQRQLVVNAGTNFMADAVADRTMRYAIYVRSNDTPTANTYDFRAWSDAAGAAALIVPNINAGTYRVCILNSNQQADVFFGDLAIRYDAYTPQPLTNNVASECFSRINNREIWFSIAVPAGQHELFIETEPCDASGGNANLYVHRGVMPTNIGQFTWSSSSGDNSELVYLLNPPADTYYIMVRGSGGSAFSNVNVKALYRTSANIPPVLNVIRPQADKKYLEHSLLRFEADASDPDGWIQRVRFLLDGATVGVDSNAPYLATYTNTSVSGVEPKQVLVRAIDDRNATTVVTRTISYYQDGALHPVGVNTDFAGMYSIDNAGRNWGFTFNLATNTRWNLDIETSGGDGDVILRAERSDIIGSAGQVTQLVSSASGTNTGQIISRPNAFGGRWCVAVSANPTFRDVTLRINATPNP